CDCSSGCPFIFSQKRTVWFSFSFSGGIYSTCRQTKHPALLRQPATTPPTATYSYGLFPSVPTLLCRHYCSNRYYSTGTNTAEGPILLHCSLLVELIDIGPSEKCWVHP
ncbi:unnamed protein product, partial [Laminaria digitata]